MAYYQYFNGQIRPIDDFLLQTNDLSILRGYGMFDYFRTYNGFPFRWEDYWARFSDSANFLKLAIPVQEADCYQIVKQLITLSCEQEVAIRFILTGGYSKDSVHIEKPNFIIRTEPLPKDNPLSRIQGIKVLPYEFVRDIPTVKMTNYVHMILMADAMTKTGSVDLLYHKNGEISELTRSNIFHFKNNKLITTHQNILEGITRKVILELAEDHFEIEIRKVILEEILQADEVFTTSTTKWVTPIVEVGNTRIGTGKAGKNTLLLAQLFEKVVKNWKQ